MENNPLIIPEITPAINPAYQVGRILILFEKKKKYRLSRKRAIPRSNIKNSFFALFTKVTAK